MKYQFKYFVVIVFSMISFLSYSDSKPASNTKPNTKFDTAQASKVTLIPAEHFARLPMFKNPELSPDGKRMMAKMMIDGAEQLVIMKLNVTKDDIPEPVVPIASGKYHINWYEWANNDRIIASIRMTKKIPRTERLINMSRLAAVDRDGSNFMNFRMKANEWGVLKQHARVSSFLPDKPDYILAELDNAGDSFNEPEIDLVNINTGKRKKYLRNRRGINGWIADNDGVVRIGGSYSDFGKKINYKIHYRKDEDSDWEILQKARYGEDDRLIPYRFDKRDNNILLVSSTDLSEASREQKEKSKLYRYDLTKREVLGVYVDEEVKELVALVKEVMPGKTVKLMSSDKSENRRLFRVSSDDFPAVYFLLDIKLQKFELVAAEYPNLLKAPLSKMKKVNYKARDGLKIPAYFSIPKNAKAENLPLIVFPHGGPFSRDRWGFNNYVQFLTSRGYAVLQPQFRGSTGQGKKHERAGYRQWGLKMQDDLTDGVNWLVKQGKVDKNRVCIMGGSYGGYAASFALINTPDLYRCAISINGVQNFPDMIEGTLYNGEVHGLFKKKLIAEGDNPKKYSPYHRAKEVNKPIMLIVGEHDVVVPSEQTYEFYEELKDLDKDVELIELEKGEHWRTNETNEILKFKAIERFLSEHLSI